MKLSAWLAENDMDTTAFAALIGVTRPAVDRYVAGSRLPSRRVMGDIVAATAGAVTPNDFYAGEDSAA